MTRRAVVAPDEAAIVDRLATRIVGLARTAQTEGRRFSLALSGGRTPEGLYRALAGRYRSSLPWDDLDFFWADERAVPPADPLSNFGLAQRSLFGDAPVNLLRVHRIFGEMRSPSAAAEAYEADLNAFFGGTHPDLRTFDVVLLGIGPDGHTASLFPGRPSLDVADRWVVDELQPGQPPAVPRITLTFAALRTARRLLFLVTGAEKRTVLESVWREPEGGRAQLPAARATAREEVTWYLDAAAAPSSVVRPPEGL